MKAGAAICHTDSVLIQWSCWFSEAPGC